MRKYLLIAIALLAAMSCGRQVSESSSAVSFDEVLETRRSIRDFDASKEVTEAPVFIVSTFVKGLSGFSRGKIFNEIGDGWGAYDNGLGNAYLVLKARAMGFDTLIMGMRDSEALRALFGIPDGEEVMAVIALGHRANDPVKPTRKPLDEIAKFF